MRDCQRLIGFVVAVFVLVGRWTPGRLADDDSASSFLLEPRLWTVVGLVLLTCLAFWQRRSGPAEITRSPTRGAAWLTLIFLGYVMITALWAPDADMARDKCYELTLLFVAIACLGPLLRLSNAEEFRFAFWSVLVLLTGIMAVSALILFGGDRMAVFGGGPNVFGRNMGLMILGVMYLRPRLHVGFILVWIPLVVLGILLIVMSGSRGALLAAVSAGAVYLLADKMSIWGKSAVVTVAAGLIWVVLTQTTLGSAVTEMFQSRVTELTIEQNYTSGREDLVLDALDMARDRPWLGQGVSGFRAIVGMYPHNIFLETLTETGLIGTGLLCAVFLSAALAVRRVWRHASGATLSAFAHALVASQLSGDLFDSRGVFVLMLLALVPETLKKGAEKRRAVAPINSKTATEIAAPAPRHSRPAARPVGSAHRRASAASIASHARPTGNRMDRAA